MIFQKLKWQSWSTGAAGSQYETVRKLIEWRRANGLHPERHRSYGIHYNDPRKTPPEEYRVDFCVSVDHDVPSNPEGVVNKTIPGGRCALVRHFGSRENVSAAEYLYEIWFPASGEILRDFRSFFITSMSDPTFKKTR